MNKEILIECKKLAILNDKGLNMLINMLLHPEKEKLQNELIEVLNEGWLACHVECKSRKPPKGHPKNCKVSRNCPDRKYLLNDKEVSSDL
jgi:hypothetical protein